MTSRGPFQNKIFSVSMADILTRVSVYMTSVSVCMKQSEIMFLVSLQTTICTGRDIAGMFVASRTLLYLHTDV